MDYRLLNNTAKMVFLVLMLLFAHASTSPTGSAPDSDKLPEKDKYAPVNENNSSINFESKKSEETESVKLAPAYDFEGASTGLPAPAQGSSYNLNNNTVPANSSDTSGLGKSASLNLAIIPVLAIFFIVIIVCIKCCNRVKADVEKDKDFVEDGKPLFRIEPESHPDYLSSIGSAYNPYSTVTSGYNPYNTVTTMMSNMSTVSETKDAGTMVKPRDIWKSMRHGRGSSVPDLEELARERDFIDSIAEEVKKLKSKTSISKLNSSPAHSKSPVQSSTKPRTAMKVRKSFKPKLHANPLSASDDNVLNPGHHQHKLVLADIQCHSESPSPSTEENVPDESQSLLGWDKSQSRDSPSSPSTQPKAPLLTVSVPCEELPESKSSDAVSCSGSASSSDRSCAEGNDKNGSGSRLRSPGKTKSLSVSFKDHCNPPNRNSNRSRSRSPVSPASKSSRPKDVEIVRKPVTSASDLPRKFSLSKVPDGNNTSSSEISESLSTSSSRDTSQSDKDSQNADKLVENSGVPLSKQDRQTPKYSKNGSLGLLTPLKISTENIVPNGLSSSNGPVDMPTLSCH